MEIIEIQSADDLFDHLDVRRDARPYLAVNAALGGRDAFVERLRAADTLVTGFGGVLHPGNPWTNIVARMPHDLADANRAQARALFDTPNPSTAQEFALLFADVDRMVRSSFTQKTVREIARRAHPPRVGAVTFVKSFAKERRCIVSFGVWDYIMAWGGSQFPWCDVAALRLDFAPLDRYRLVGCHWQTAVVGSNKGLAADAFCARIGADPARVLAIGDSPTDLAMIHPGNVGILMLPHTDDDALRRQFRRDGIVRMWPRCSAVLVADTFDGLNALRAAS